jgi:hypothetical protein
MILISRSNLAGIAALALTYALLPSLRCEEPRSKW